MILLVSQGAESVNGMKPVTKIKATPDNNSAVSTMCGKTFRKRWLRFGEFIIINANRIDNNVALSAMVTR
ncbi:hypothetical protein D035_2211 [Vibrio parahaemolyticus VP250]|nr:hypothetical protein D035_2211 [Vibrio parahaemolyticus VP250]